MRHLFKEFGADEVGLAPGGEHLIAGEGRIDVGDVEEVAEGGAELALLAEVLWFEQHGAATNEELPPQFAGGFEGFGAEGFDAKSSGAEGVGGGAEGGAGLGRDRGEAVVFEVADGDLRWLVRW